MKACKISTTIICFIFFIHLPLSAEKICCKKYSGTYEEYTFSVSFSNAGKMLIAVNSKNGRGYYSVPGTYIVKESSINFFYKGLSRTISINNGTLSASLYSFGLEDNFENKIILQEDKEYPSSCR